MLGAIAFFFIGLFVAIMPVSLIALFFISASVELATFIIVVGELWFAIGIAVAYYRETHSGNM